MSDRVLSESKWIWCCDHPQPDEYGEFVSRFIYHGGSALLRVSADSNYAAYINGQLAAWGQYADFPHHKVYDEVDVFAFCREGENRLCILVWYYGVDFIFTYYPGRAGLLYALTCGDEVLCRSGENTLSRLSRAYRNHTMHIITPQLGLGYGYDSSAEDNWLNEDVPGFSPSVIVEQTLPLIRRPCEKLQLLDCVPGTLCKRVSDTDVIFDLGSEQVGFLSFSLFSPCEQELTVSYGEHLVDGCVRRKIGPRDFSAAYRAKPGENSFLNPFRRFACRYLQVQSQQPLTVFKIGIAPTVYPLRAQKRPALTPIQNKIYDLCAETLRLCMHEHYEDCPWREQSLYAMDSRNQMLCGYYAFGEFAFPKANLQLISWDQRPDGLLSICYPMAMDLVIPSFSLHYITACREYLDYSGDTGFLRQIYPKLRSVLHAFTSRIRNGLMPPFPGKVYWNFYEWRAHLDGGGPYCEDYDFETPDLIINALLSIALGNMAAIADALDEEQDYRAQSDALNIQIRNTFWDADAGICYNLPSHDAYSQLGNSLAVLCGAIRGADARNVCLRMLSDPNMTPISLSMICFKYDAWRKVDAAYFTPEILRDIERIYTPMIQFGSTTVWETELGEKDFDNAGSLCHGWSALPIYYYHQLLPPQLP